MNYTKILFSAALIFNIYIVEAQSIVIKNAMIYDGMNDDAFSGNILIEEGVIKKVSQSSIQGDTVIDAGGKIVTPGFIASDTEIGIVEIGALSVTRDDQSSIYSIGFSIHDAFNPNSTLIPWNRSNGTYFGNYPTPTNLNASCWHGLLFYFRWQYEHIRQTRYGNAWQNGRLIRITK